MKLPYALKGSPIGIQAIAWALVIGLMGAPLPVIRAAHLTIVEAPRIL
jgi:hypothetical protein